MSIANGLRWAGGFLLAAVLVAAPYLYYRWTFEHAKRLRPVVDGLVYRSGCMTSNGLRETVQKLGIKTVINLMEEAPDPDLKGSRFDQRTIKESELCAAENVDFRFIYLQTVPENRVGKDRPGGIDEFLKIMDDPNSYPVLFHCKAGLHRTGALAALYRIEYQHWSAEEAMRELKANGFGHFTANTTNELCYQYVLTYQPRWAAVKTVAAAPVALHR